MRQRAPSRNAERQAIVSIADASAQRVEAIRRRLLGAVAMPRRGAAVTGAWG